jgi:glycosyltransferase involved in cell wall biosynthesis
MRICFIVGEIFHWGTFGGFGALTRTIGSNLVKRGVEVFVVMLYETKQEHKTIETLDGMTVVTLPSRRDLTLYKACDADVYHSEDATSGSYYAQKAVQDPQVKHVITFQDPMYIDELILSQLSYHKEWSSPLYRLSSRLRFRAGYRYIREAVHNADGLYAQAKYIIPKISSMYGLREASTFLPNPVDIPQRRLRKADRPTVCFLGRWEPVKGVERFMELARAFPAVRFVAAGRAHDDERDRHLRETYKDVPNLEMPGWVFGEAKDRMLEESWVMINTSVRECLPVSYLEGAAYECAILSSNNPDDFASNFGYHVQDHDYAKGLRALLDGDAWRTRGKTGRRYVEATHELSRVIDTHLSIYKDLL